MQQNFRNSVEKLKIMMKNDGEGMNIRFLKDYTEINFNTMSHFLGGLARLERQNKNGKQVKWQDFAKVGDHKQMTKAERDEIYDLVLYIYKTVNGITAAYADGLVAVITNSTKSMNANMKTIERLENDKAKNYKEVGTKKANDKGKGKNKNTVKAKTAKAARAKATTPRRAPKDRVTTGDVAW
jgi:hypothetical protein